MLGNRIAGGLATGTSRDTMQEITRTNGRRMADAAEDKYVTRSGLKLAHALEVFRLGVTGRTCADLGSHQGGFVDCLLAHGAAKVYSVDTSYGTLAWKLRKDPRVVVLERTNAMHLVLPEPVDLVTIDVGWTRQRHVLPAARQLVKPEGRIVSLVKPQYEALDEERIAGVVPEEKLGPVLVRVRIDVAETGLSILGEERSPIKGGGGNVEYLWLLGRKNGSEKGKVQSDKRPI
jgi:23S rRNA (cytidine1920-2'-O)/16S rRNA (cytidine1409-2'-O)-methyltransferase